MTRWPWFLWWRVNLVWACSVCSGHYNKRVWAPSRKGSSTRISYQTSDNFDGEKLIMKKEYFWNDMKASSFLVVFFLPEAQNDFRILKFVHQNATFYEYCIKYKMKLRSGWRGENFQHFDGGRWGGHYHCSCFAKKPPSYMRCPPKDKPMTNIGFER